MYKYIIVVFLLFGCSKDDVLPLREGNMLHEGNSKIWTQILYAKTEDGNVEPLQPIQDRWIFYSDHGFEVEKLNNKGIWILAEDGFWVLDGEDFRLIINNIFIDFKLLSLIKTQLILESKIDGIIFNEVWETF